MPTDTPLNRGGNKRNGQRDSVVIILDTITKNNIPKQRPGKYANQGYQAFHAADQHYYLQ
jgi:hypothetical protein